MSIFSIICITFAVMGFSTLGMAFWTVWYPKTICQKRRMNDTEYNICIKPDKHDGPHMTADGRTFRS